MSDYIMLFKLTTKGAERIKESADRIAEAKKIFESSGGKIKQIYAVLGEYDFVWIVEAPSDEVIAKISLHISSLGAVHGQTLRALSEDQYKAIIKSLA